MYTIKKLSINIILKQECYKRLSLLNSIGINTFKFKAMFIDINLIQIKINENS